MLTDLSIFLPAVFLLVKYFFELFYPSIIEAQLVVRLHHIGYA